MTKCYIDKYRKEIEKEMVYNNDEIQDGRWKLYNLFTMGSCCYTVTL